MSPSQSKAKPVVSNSINYTVSSVNNRVVSGWARMSIRASQPVVEVYINNVLRYKVVANLYRYETKSFDGFKVTINKNLLKSKVNLLEVRILGNNATRIVAYKGYI